jgi:hypothetical protein
MDFEDLQRGWEEQNRKLDASLRLNTRILTQSALGKAETATRRLSWLLLFELPLDALLLFGLGSFIAQHATDARFLIPAVALHLYVIVLASSSVRQVFALRGIDYSAPIVAIQKRLGALQVERTRVMKWVFLSAPLVWTPLLIVSLKGLLGVDPYAIFSGAWLAANLLFGVAVIALALWISRRYADRMERSPFLRRLMRDLAGHNLNAALGFVGSVERFEKEESPA